MNWLVNWLFKFLFPGMLRWTLALPDHITLTVKGDRIMLTLTDSQKVGLSIQPVDAKGNPAPVDGAPQWAVSDEALLTLQVADDGLSAELFAAGPLGNAQVTVSADADLGAGVTTIQGILDVTVVGGQAVSLAIAAGTPEEQ